ncbi:hypothetical protein E2986_01859 [Frieseomelitta varia]|uniref:Uncharacterized protein n=1 Tax=Frieseomelitta varia TaxID=561572 RepID=A0A833S7J9_9HYME|nr:hypothetical protein E2986_01859 [Frieseomelitta varia]
MTTNSALKDIVKKKSADMSWRYVAMRSVKLSIGVVCDGTVSTRVARTLPLDPSRWSAIFRSLWSGGRFWEWPRNSVDAFLRLVASPDTRKKMVFEFRPEDGPRASFDYQRRYGYRGERLIELLGSGFHLDNVPYQQPVPASILVPPPLL